LAYTEAELASYQTYQGFNNNFKKPLCNRQLKTSKTRP